MAMLVLGHLDPESFTSTAQMTVCYWRTAGLQWQWQW
jgi:hypothetical protein